MLGNSIIHILHLESLLVRLTSQRAKTEIFCSASTMFAIEKSEKEPHFAFFVQLISIFSVRSYKLIQFPFWISSYRTLRTTCSIPRNNICPSSSNCSSSSTFRLLNLSSSGCRRYASPLSEYRLTHAVPRKLTFRHATLNDSFHVSRGSFLPILHYGAWSPFLRRVYFSQLQTIFRSHCLKSVPILRVRATTRNQLQHASKRTPSRQLWKSKRNILLPPTSSAS